MLDIVRATGAPLPVAVGGRTLMVAPPGARMRGMLLAWLACRPEIRAAFETGSGSEPPPGWLPRWGGPLALEALLEDGRGLLVYATTRADHPGLSPEEADALGDLLLEDPDALEAVSQVATLGMLARDVPPPPAGDRDGPRDGGDRGGIESVDFGALMELPQLRRLAPSEVGAMTLDQIENALKAGKSGIPSSGTPYSMGQAEAYLQECLRARAEGREIPPCP